VLSLAAEYVIHAVKLGGAAFTLHPLLASRPPPVRALPAGPLSRALAPPRALGGRRAGAFPSHLTAIWLRCVMAAPAASATRRAPSRRNVYQLLEVA
jgi:hypothetical protein